MPDMGCGIERPAARSTMTERPSLDAVASCALGDGIVQHMPAERTVPHVYHLSMTCDWLSARPWNAQGRRDIAMHEVPQHVQPATRWRCGASFLIEGETHATRKHGDGLAARYTMVPMWMRSWMRCGSCRRIHGSGPALGSGHSGIRTPVYQPWGSAMEPVPLFDIVILC